MDNAGREQKPNVARWFLCIGAVGWVAITAIQSDSYDEFCSRVGHSAVEFFIGAAAIGLGAWVSGAGKYRRFISWTLVLLMILIATMPLLLTRMEVGQLSQQEYFEATKRMIEAERAPKR